MPSITIEKNALVVGDRGDSVSFALTPVPLHLVPGLFWGVVGAGKEISHIGIKKRWQVQYLTVLMMCSLGPTF